MSLARVTSSLPTGLPAASLEAPPTATSPIYLTLSSQSCQNMLSGRSLPPSSRPAPCIWDTIPHLNLQGPVSSDFCLPFGTQPLLLSPTDSPNCSHTGPFFYLELPKLDLTLEPLSVLLPLPGTPSPKILAKSATSPHSGLGEMRSPQRGPPGLPPASRTGSWVRPVRHSGAKCKERQVTRKAR